MNGFSAEPGERSALVMSIQPPGRSSPPDPTSARTARVRVSITMIATRPSAPCSLAVLAANGSSRRCRSASRVVITLAWSAGAARAIWPARCQASDGNGARPGIASTLASSAWAWVIIPARTILASTALRAAWAAPWRRSGRRLSGAWGRAISSACSASVRTAGSWPK